MSLSNPWASLTLPPFPQFYFVGVWCCQIKQKGKKKEKKKEQKLSEAPFY